MNKEIHWGILGCGVVAHEMGQALQNSGKKIYGVANRTRNKAEEFAKKYQVEKVYDHIEDIFHDPKVDVIYITTPHNTHIQFLREALSHRKHVLCEKAITLNSGELEEALTIAREHGVILMEAMTIFHMPLHKKMKSLIDAGTYGQVNMIQVNFGSYKEYNMNNRFFNRNLAGGSLLDIGVYAISLVRLYMNQNPNMVKSQVRMASTGVDEQAGILLMNDLGQMATISLSLHSKQPKRVTISCDKAYIEIFQYPRGEKAVVTYTEDGHTETIEEGETQRALQYEMEDMEEAILNGGNTHIQETRDVMQIMTEIRREWNMTYPEEEMEMRS